MIGIALWNGLRVGGSVFFRKTLSEYGAHSLLIAASGGVWLLLGLALAWGVWRGEHWAWMASIAGAAGYTLWRWFGRLVLQEHHHNNAMALATTALLLTFTKDNHGTKPKTSPTA